MRTINFLLCNSPRRVAHIMDVLPAVYALAVQIKVVYDGVQGNKEQCKMLHDQVQHVAASLKALPDPTKRKTEVKAAVSSLRETLRSCLDLIGEFKKTHWIKKAVFSTTGKFEALFVELDRVLQVCGFALEVRTKQYTFSYLFILSFLVRKNIIIFTRAYKSSRRATRRTPVLCKAPCDCLNSEALYSSNRVASTLHQYSI